MKVEEAYEKTKKNLEAYDNGDLLGGNPYSPIERYATAQQQEREELDKGWEELRGSGLDKPYTAQQPGVTQHKCQCGEDSTGNTEIKCCNLCGLPIQSESWYYTTLDIRNMEVEQPVGGEEMRNALETVMRLQNLMRYPDGINEEHEDEARAIDNMLKQVSDALLNSTPLVAEGEILKHILYRKFMQIIPEDRFNVIMAEGYADEVIEELTNKQEG